MKNTVSALLLGTALALTAIGVASAQDKTLKIGVLTDLSGLYADLGGQGSIVAAQMAVEDSGMAAKGWKLDVISADHQNKPDVATNIARQWIDVEKVDVLMDVLNSGVALAVNNVVKEKNSVMINSGAASSDLTNAQCTPNTVHWTYDTYMLAHSTGQALVKAGGDTWFFITADYAFGAALERDTTAVVTGAGGKVIGGVKHPLNTADFSSFLLQAQASKAKIIGMANAGGDTTNTIKQASEFGIVAGGQKLAGLLLFITDVNSLGLKVAQGLNLSSTFYWDMNDQNSRVFQAVFRAHEDQGRADHGAGRCLFGTAALFQGDGCVRRQSARRRQGCRQDEGNADRRSAVRQGHHSRRWPKDSPGLLVRSEKPLGVQGTVGLLQADRNHPGRSGLQAVV